MSVVRFPSEWERMATGTNLANNDVSFTRSAQTVRSMATDDRLRYWSAAVWAVDVGTDGAELARVEVATARMIEFDLPDTEWSDALDAADEFGETDLMEAMSAISTDAAASAGLDELVTMRGLFISKVSVDERVRGHRWGRTAVASLLDLVPFDDALVFGVLSDPSDPAATATAEIASAFSAEIVGSSRVVWTHTSLRSAADAVHLFAGGPYPFL